MTEKRLTAAFDQFATRASAWAGHPLAFLMAVTLLLVWAVTGPLVAFSEDWQLLINTGTTIVTFLMVFIIQNSQNRGDLAQQIKLDEIIRSIHGAKNELIGLEEMSGSDLDRLHDKFQKIADSTRRHTLAIAQEKKRRKAKERHNHNDERRR